MESQAHSFAPDVNAHLPRVNNAIYTELGQRWYDAQDDPVALLRAESGLRNPWVQSGIVAAGLQEASVLDIGCGGGFLSNYLACQGHRVTGLDESAEALGVAASRDVTGAVRYAQGDALDLPFESASFDVVCAMDFLEHVEDPERAIGEAARVLRPGGLFYFHTFNRNPLAWLIVIRGVEWFVKNTPRHMHVLHLFLKPSEVDAMCGRAGLGPASFVGTRPRLDRAFAKMLWTREVPHDFSFVFTRSTLLGYSGWTRRAP